VPQSGNVCGYGTHRPRPCIGMVSRYDELQVRHCRIVSDGRAQCPLLEPHELRPVPIDPVPVVLTAERERLGRMCDGISCPIRPAASQLERLLIDAKADTRRVTTIESVGVHRPLRVSIGVCARSPCLATVISNLRSAVARVFRDRQMPPDAARPPRQRAGPALSIRPPEKRSGLSWSHVECHTGW